MLDTTSFEGVPNSVVFFGVERLLVVNCRNPHFDFPWHLCSINHSVRHQMIRCLICASKPCLIFRLNLITSGIQSAVQYCRKQFVQRKQRADRAVVSNIFNDTFLCITFSLILYHSSSVHSFCFITSLKICITISFVSSSHVLMSSVTVSCFAFF